MENNCIGIINIPDNLKRFVTIMRITLFLIFFGILYTHAAEGFSQDVKFSIDTNKTTVEEIFKEIESESNYRFLLDGNAKEIISKTVEISSNSQNIDEILNEILSSTEFSHKILDNQVVIYKDVAKKVVVKNEKIITEQVLQPSKKELRGNIVDSEGMAIIGANVIEIGTTNGTVTDIDGNFSLEIEPNSTLRISYIGYLEQEISATGKTFIDVVLYEDLQSLDEIVVVGYGTQSRGSITGAVASVDGEAILKAPTMSVSNMIGARVPGISAVQSSGQPGADQAGIRVRGQGGIVYVIDGIRRTSNDFNEIDPNEIESVSVLKDASSVSVYGLDANAAIIVTTKRGKFQKMSITYTGNYGWSNNAEQQRWLDGPEYAYWYNKARVMQGDTQIFTTEMVKKMREGVDGWGNNNWYDKLYGTATRNNHNLSASGGNDKMNFFTSIGFLDENGNLDNYKYKRYNLRSNIDAKLTNNITLSLGVSGRIEDHDEPRFSADPDAYNPVPQQIIRMLPYMADKYVFEGREYNVATNITGSLISPYASINEAGYNRKKNAFVQTNFLLKYDAPWLEGLSFQFQGAFDMFYGMNKLLGKPYEVMRMNLPSSNTDVLTYTLQNGLNGNTALLVESSSRRYNITSQSQVNYSNRFGKHNISAMLLSETREATSNSIHATGHGLDFIQLDELGRVTNLTGDGDNKAPEINGASGQSRVAGFVGRLTYNYDNKYYAEGSLRYDGSYLFGGMNKRWVTLPGFSLAWRINNEDWFDFPTVYNLKLRAGIGKTATSGVSAFQWRNTMGIVPNSVVIGGASQSYVYPSVLGNPNLTWAQSLNYNLGLDVSLWEGKLGMEFDVFYKFEYDQLTGTTGSYPPSMGKYYFATENVNEADYKGFDLALYHTNRFGDFNFGTKLIWSYVYGRWIKYAGDSENAPEYRRLTGKQIGSKLGLIAEGLFQDEQEILDSPTFADRPARTGYIKYKDLNGDGVLTLEQDQGYFGESSIPTHTGSLELFGDWKGFDFNLLFSWGLGSSVSLTGQTSRSGIAGSQIATSYTRPFYGGGNSPLYLVANAWTPENTDAIFPRLEVTPLQGGNNNMSSSFWYKSGDYLRLKTAQIGYNFPKQWFETAGIDALRIYAEGFNLMTWSAVSKFNIDPESPAVNDGYYPQQRKYALGIKITF